MGEINEALGIGEVFIIDEEEYTAHIATFEQLERIEEITKGLFLQAQSMHLNFIKLIDEKDNKARDERKNKLLNLLQIIFPDAPVEKLKKINRKEMAKAVSYFLFD